ncbi:MAG: hypothetical protein R3F58_02140 [Steroidobacteraceae bacterium]|mgnify:CR=1 FL=1
MKDLFKNRLAYLSTSLILLVVAFPLISVGTTRGFAVLWWAGLLALGCGGLIPPLQRLLLGPPPTEVAPAAAHDAAKRSQLKGTKP